MFPWNLFLKEQGEDEVSLYSIPFYDEFGATTDFRGQIAIKFDENNDTIIRVFSGTNIGNGVSTTLHDLKDNSTNLKVPAGKKWFVAVTCDGATGTNWKLRGSATVDTADGTTYFDRSRTMTAGSLVTSPVVELAANEFLTIEHPSGAGNIIFKGAIVIEKTA